MSSLSIDSCDVLPDEMQTNEAEIFAAESRTEAMTMNMREELKIFFNPKDWEQHCRMHQYWGAPAGARR